jgi:hypothetical protein
MVEVPDGKGRLVKSRLCPFVILLARMSPEKSRS